MSERRKSNHESFQELKGMISVMDGKIDQLHGRVKSIESVVIGDEGKSIIGLAEKFRIMEKDNKSLDKKRATVFVVVGWIAAFFGSYILKEVLPEKATPVVIQTPKYPGLIRVTKDGHTYLIDGLNLDLGGHIPDAGREHDMAQKATRHQEPENMFDEAKWSEAKEEVKKSHAGWEESNPRLWKLISSVYKSMGGELSETLQKSLAAIDALEKITPTFIQDPRLWLTALKKSGVDHEVPGAVYGNLGLTIKCYAEMGGQLVKSSMLDFEKAVAHKYTGKVALPGGGFKYLYGDDGGDKKEAAAPAAPHKPVAAAKAPEAKKAPQSAYAKSIEALSRKTDADAKESLQNVDYAHLAGMHGDMRQDDPKRALVAQAMQDKKRVADKAKAGAKEKSIAKSQNNSSFDTFEKKNFSEVKSSLRKSHPEWDTETLESRTASQLRQLFKFQ